MIISKNYKLTKFVGKRYISKYFKMFSLVPLQYNLTAP